METEGQEVKLFTHTYEIHSSDNRRYEINSSVPLSDEQLTTEVEACTDMVGPFKVTKTNQSILRRIFTDIQRNLGILYAPARFDLDAARGIGNQRMRHEKN